MRYRVRIEHREPTYDLREGKVRGPFTTDSVIEAAGPEDAGRIARARFERLASQSDMHWVREVTSCTVEALDTPPMTLTIGPKRDGMVPGWWCDASVDGTAYQVGVISIPGSGSRPDVWGVVKIPDGPIVWQDRVAPTIAPREILRLAGLSAAR